MNAKKDMRMKYLGGNERGGGEKQPGMRIWWCEGEEIIGGKRMQD